MCIRSYGEYNFTVYLLYPSYAIAIGIHSIAVYLKRRTALSCGISISKSLLIPRNTTLKDPLYLHFHKYLLCPCRCSSYMHVNSELVLFLELNRSQITRHIIIAPGRFELPSEGPEPPMLGHYTTGLHMCRWFLIKITFLRLCLCAQVLPQA